MISPYHVAVTTLPDGVYKIAIVDKQCKEYYSNTRNNGAECLCHIRYLLDRIEDGTVTELFQGELF